MGCSILPQKTHSSKPLSPEIALAFLLQYPAHSNKRHHLKESMFKFSCSSSIPICYPLKKWSPKQPLVSTESTLVLSFIGLKLCAGPTASLCGPRKSWYIGNSAAKFQEPDSSHPLFWNEKHSMISDINWLHWVLPKILLNSRLHEKDYLSEEKNCNSGGRKSTPYSSFCSQPQPHHPRFQSCKSMQIASPFTH